MAAQAQRRCMGMARQHACAAALPGCCSKERTRARTAWARMHPTTASRTPRPAAPSRLEALILHRRAAVLDDDGLAAEALQVRQRLGQHADAVKRGEALQGLRVGRAAAGGCLVGAGHGRRPGHGLRRVAAAGCGGPWGRVQRPPCKGRRAPALAHTSASEGGAAAASTPRGGWAARRCARRAIRGCWTAALRLLGSGRAAPWGAALGVARACNMSAPLLPLYATWLLRM